MINFLNPTLAFVGLACVALPILIHILMRRRRKPVQWAAMRFLLEAYKQQRKRLRLEQLLLLASRCLLVALVALALGRPLLSKAGLLGGRGSVTLYLLLDNGIASSATSPGDEGSALDRHKAAAKSLIAQLDPAAGDRAALVTLGGPAQGLVSPPSSNTAAVADLVKNLAPTDSASDLPGAFAIVRQALDARRDEKAGQQVVVILSDFLAGSADTERKLTELGTRDGLIVMASSPLPAGPGNVSIAAVEPLRPVVIAGGQGPSSPQTSVSVRLRRTGPASAEAAATSVRLQIQAETPGGLGPPTTVGQTTVRWTAGQSEATASAPADLSPATKAAGACILTAIIDNDGIAGDNTWRRPIEVRHSIRVGLIAPRRLGSRPSIQQFDPADWFRFSLETSEDVELTEIDPGTLDTPRLAGLDAAIIATPEAIPDGAWKKLRLFADAGGLLIVSPPPKVTVHTWTDAFTRDLALPWSLGREAKSWPTGQTIATDRLASTPGGSADLLTLLAAELPDLSRPVKVFRLLPIDQPAGHAAPGTLLSLADGSPLLLAAPPGSKESALAPGQDASPAPRGLVVLLAAPFSFDWTDLQAKPLMVPLVQEIIRQGLGRARGSWSALAGQSPPTPPRSLELRAVGEAQPATVKVAVDRAAEPMRHAGVWHAIDESGSDRGLVTVNADPSGSRTEAQSPASIGAWISSAVGGTEIRWLEPDQRIGGTAVAADSLRSILQRGEDGTRFAIPLLIAALAIAVLELALARWFSHAVERPLTTATPASAPPTTEATA
jgi:hypothetical protein